MLYFSSEIKVEIIPNKTQNIYAFSSRDEMGKEAAKAVEKRIVELQKTQPLVRMIFAAAPSQNEMLAHLLKSETINWEKVVAFNMDEYVGLAQDSSESFANYLKTHIFNHIKCKEVNLINGEASPEEEIKKHAGLLSEAPIDIVCLGIGENGHIAFNDPPVADFNDPEVVKIVELEEACRIQQVNDKCFENLDLVPKRAFTITIPVIMNATSLFCVAPGETKREAVGKTFSSPIDVACPSTILRTHNDCTFFFDNESFGKSKNN